MTECLYYDAPLSLEFTAQVIGSRPLKEGRIGILLPRTYFYPTSGGQENDTGFIGQVRILDVYKDGEEILHVADQALAPGEYPARIDRERRLRAMQHHTAQHILSAAFLEVAGIDSLSANINGATPSTIDLEVSDITPEVLRRAEYVSNSLFFENRVVKTYYVSQEEIAHLPVRKPPKVSGLIRIVEVDGFDFTACGGTHCPTTGMIGLLKVVRTERVNQRLRVHFVAGYQALDYFHFCQDVAQQAANLLETGLEGIPTALGRKLGQFQTTQTELETLRAGLLTTEAEQLIASAAGIGRLHLVTAILPARSNAEMRGLALRLRNAPALVSLLATYASGKLSLVVACSQDSGVDARDLLNKHLAPLNLRGGGDRSLAQGGGAMEETRLKDLFEHTKDYL